VVDGGTGNDLLAGGAGRDTVLGGAGNDRVSGGEGADLLGGGEGNDTLLGDAGADLLFGGIGADLLRGGGGADRFVFNARTEGGDVIADFRPGEGDKVAVLGTAFFYRALASGPAAGSQIGFFFETTTGVLSYFDGFARTPLATLEGVSSMTIDDLVFF
jgi:Ca2+-binding RTX toxin-like protein